MAEQFEETVEIGGFFIAAVHFFFTVAGEDQDRGAIFPDVI